MFDHQSTGHESRETEVLPRQFGRTKSRRSTNRKLALESLEQRRLLSVAVWTGAANDYWANPANWQGNAVPTSGQDVSFSGNSGSSITILLPASVTVGTIYFSGDYNLAGSSVTVNGNINSTEGASTVENVALTHNTSINAEQYASITVTNPTDGGNGYGITSTGQGAVIISGTSASYTGPTVASAGTLEIDSSVPSPLQANAGGDAFGSGTVAGVSVQSGGKLSFGKRGGIYMLPTYLTSSNGLSLASGSTLLETCDFDTESVSDFGSISVTSGAINLNSATLSLANADPGEIPPNSVITLISNSTGNAINGTFAALPQGGVIQGYGGPYQVSYTGGASGHDVTLTVLPVASWTGAAGDNQWSTAANWSTSTVPIAGQSVTFPDYPGVQPQTISLSQNVEVDELQILGSYTIQNDTITVDGDIGGYGTSDLIASNLIFSGRESILTNAGAFLKITGSITGSSVELSLGGGTNSAAEAGVVEIDGTLSDVGPIDIGGVNLDLNTSVNSIVDVEDYSTLEGNASVAQINDSAGIVSLGHGNTATTLNSSQWTALQGGALDELISSNTTAGELVASGSQVLLSNLAFNLSAVAGADPTFGHTFTVISNQTGAAIDGTFPGLPEGATVAVDGVTYQISYVGGSSGKDVTLTVVNPLPSMISLTSSHVPVYQGEHVTLTATVSGATVSSGTPTGTVTFYDDGTAIASAVPLVAGVATFNDTTLPIGSDSITATYSGDANFTTSNTAAPLIASVRPPPGGTTPTIASATSSTSTHGYTVSMTVVGADSGTDGASGLTYRWTAIHLPSGAKTPTFSVNNTNTAGSVVARFSKDGGYTLRCTVTNAAGNAATADVAVTVSQKATSIKIEPHGVHLKKDVTQQFTGTVLDQFDHTMRTPQPLSYEVLTGGGSINSSGLYTAPSMAARVTVEVNVDDLAATLGIIVG